MSFTVENVVQFYQMQSRPQVNVEVHAQSIADLDALGAQQGGLLGRAVFAMVDADPSLAIDHPLPGHRFEAGIVRLAAQSSERVADRSRRVRPSQHLGHTAVARHLARRNTAHDGVNLLVEVGRRSLF